MKHYSVKLFRISDDISIHCWAENTRYGFRHLGILQCRYHQFEAKICYYNRTWEAFEYQSLIERLAYRAEISTADKDTILTYAKSQH